MSTIRTEKMSNNLTVIVEEVPYLESVAYDLEIPGGILHDREGQVGTSLVLAEITSRGAGVYDAKALSDEFDSAGIRHGEYSGHDRFVYRGALLPDKLEKALSLVSDMVLRPTVPEHEIPGIQSLLLQDIRSLKDNPSRWVMVELGTRYYPNPHGRPGMGSEEGIEKVTASLICAEWERLYRPSKAVLSIAGNVRTAEVLALAEKYFGEWKGNGVERPPFGKVAPHAIHHISTDAAQLQIALAFPSVKYGDPLYYAAKVGNGVLSGGMFGRLFIEVREKRGLCYSVYSRHSASIDYGSVTAYAGTTPERAQETLDVLLKELRSVKGTVTDEELSRSVANLKSGLIIGEESAGSRASSNAGDYLTGGKTRTLEEVASEVDKVTKEMVDQYFDSHSVDDSFVVTLGSRELQFS